MFGSAGTGGRASSVRRAITAATAAFALLAGLFPGRSEAQDNQLPVARRGDAPASFSSTPGGS